MTTVVILTYKSFTSPLQAVFVGAFIGSTLSFLLGRYLFRAFVVRLASRYAIFQAVDKALEGNGLKIMVLLRLSPLIPYNALDYISGITSISLRVYCIGLVAILPGVIMFTYVGATASSLLSSKDEASKNMAAKVFSMVFGVVFAVVGVLVASYYSKIELDKVREKRRADKRIEKPNEKDGGEGGRKRADVCGWKR